MRLIHMPRYARLAPIALALLAGCKGDGPIDPVTSLTPCLASDETIAVSNLAVGQTQVVSGNALNSFQHSGIRSLEFT